MGITIGWILALWWIENESREKINLLSIVQMPEGK